MLSLKSWARGLTTTSALLVLVCGALLIDDELQSRRTRALIDEQWIPAFDSYLALNHSEQLAIAALSDFEHHRSRGPRQHALSTITSLDNALEHASIPSADAQFVSLSQSARKSAREWVTGVAASVLADDPPRLSKPQLALSEEMLDSSRTLTDAIAEGSQPLRSSLRRTEALLRTTVAIETVLLLILIMAMLIGIDRRVLRPLSSLRRDLSTSTRHHEHVIAGCGPAEIASVGSDAELLRRALVHEHDTAAQKSQALEQAAPITVAIHAALDQSGAAVPGIHGFHRPIEGVIAGDWWWAGERTDGRRVFAMADIAGHGVPAGVIALQSQAIVSTALQAGVPLAVIAHSLAVGGWDPGRFLTLFMGVLDGESLEFCSAGHPFALLLEAGQTQVLPTTGPVVSGLGGQWTSMTIHMARGTACLIATDGLIECSDDSTVTRWASEAWHQAQGDAAEALELLMGQAREQSLPWADDITVIIATQEQQWRTPADT
ncbi:MAG: PP2C family protein-serine/threonine phosphatase [Candidatus Nanopelagicales bacterium]